MMEDVANILDYQNNSVERRKSYLITLWKSLETHSRLVQQIPIAGRKEFMIKSVDMSMPVYTMTCFRIPKGICDDINRLLAYFWWNSGLDSKSMHYLAWKRLSLPKKEGGLGFRSP